MLLRIARVVPWCARASRSRPERRFSTVMLPSSTTTPTSGRCSNVSVPFGPLTVTTRAFVSTVTPSGTAIGFLPMRDMFRSSDGAERSGHRAQDLAADALGAALAIGEHALVGRDHGDPEAAADPRELVDAAIPPAPRLAEAGDVRDHLLALGAIAEIDADHALRAVRVHLVVADVALALQHVEDAHLHRTAGARAGGVLRAQGVADPRQQVRDRVGHHGVDLGSLVESLVEGTVTGTTACGTGSRAPRAAPCPPRRSSRT